MEEETNSLQHDAGKGHVGDVATAKRKYAAMRKTISTG